MNFMNAFSLVFLFQKQDHFGGLDSSMSFIVKHGLQLSKAHLTEIYS